MNTRYRDEIDDDYQATGEREINLNAATILGILFLLALICGVFFAFGYTMGRKSAPSPVAETLAAPAPATVTSTPKPTPGTRTVVVDATTPSASLTASAAPAPTASDSQSTQVAQSAASPDQAPVPVPSQAVTVPTPPRPAQAVPQRGAAAVQATARTPALPPAAAAFMVQIAAVSHKEDADVLQTALEHRGYHITVVHVPQDKLIHVQVGPFANRKDAEAMRQRLLNDGYNAIVK